MAPDGVVPMGWCGGARMEGEEEVTTQRGAGRLSLALITAACLWSAVPALADEAGSVEHRLGLLTDEVAGLKTSLDALPTLNGYYDFEYLADNAPGDKSTFRQHHLTIFVGAHRGPWRFLSEVEFEDGVTLEGDGTDVEGKGAVNAENAWLERVFSDAFTVRTGKFLLPHYWNVNHYPNIVLSTNRPLMVRQVFPTDAVGLMAFGNRYRGRLGATWHAYVGNGESQTGTDDNENKAAGAHLSLHLGELFAPFVRMDVGAAVHSERTGTGAARDAVDVWGVDAQFNSHVVEVLFEYARRTADQAREGLYVQPSVKVSDTVRLFYRYDWLDTGPLSQTRHTVGVNVQPRPDVALKLEVNTNRYDSPGDEDHEQVAASVALFF
jgi:hypothetical protein